LDLLEVMARRLTPTLGEALWDRAEKLATGGSPTRAYVLGTVMIRCEAYLQAIPLLKMAKEDPESWAPMAALQFLQ